MFELVVSKNQIRVSATEPITSGSVAVYEVHFQFSTDWDGFNRFAVFDDGDARIEIPIDSSNTVNIPWEVMTDPGDIVEAGVYGIRGHQVLPTIWASLGTVEEGVLEGDLPSPTPEVWRKVTEELRQRIIDIENRLVFAPEDPITIKELEEILV